MKREKLVGEPEILREGMVIMATQTKNLGSFDEPFDMVIKGHEYVVVDVDKNRGKAIIKSLVTGEQHTIPYKLPLTGRLALFRKKEKFTVYIVNKKTGERSKIRAEGYNKPKELPFFLKDKYKIEKVVKGWKS